MTVIVDYGMGNLGSICNMLKKIGASGIIASTPQDIEKADKLILPGVGAFDNGIKNLHQRGLVPVLEQKVLSRKTPILGICLGMQLFTKRSEEGRLEGLGWIEGETIRFQFDGAHAHLKVPHMGWNTVQVVQKDVLYAAGQEEWRFYFAHSYHVVCPAEHILTRTNYGYDFVSSLRKDNISGVQFHPEKSHKFGMALLKNFVQSA